MKASEVLEIVEREIGGNWSTSNAHGVDLKRCLLTSPVKMAFEVGPSHGKTKELWLVLEEAPETKSGYKIVFDEERRSFGLAITDARTKGNVFLGYYGSFLSTLEGM
jgi:hypothetical protein